MRPVDFEDLLQQLMALTLPNPNVPAKDVVAALLVTAATVVAAKVCGREHKPPYEYVKTMAEKAYKGMYAEAKTWKEAVK